jgi:hypothetical protein
MIARRTLVRIAALAGVTPAFGAPIAPSLTARPGLAPSPGAGGTEAARMAFKIAGWEVGGEGATGDLKAGSAETAEEVWISIDRSWRATWR